MENSLYPYLAMPPKRKYRSPRNLNIGFCASILYILTDEFPGVRQQTEIVWMHLAILRIAQVGLLVSLALT